MLWLFPGLLLFPFLLRYGHTTCLMGERKKNFSKSVSVQVTGILWVFLCMLNLRLEHLMAGWHLMSLNHIIFFCQPTSWIFYRMFFVYRVDIMLERLLLLAQCSRSYRECVSHSVHLLYSFVSPFISSWFDHLRIQNPLNNRMPQQKQQQRTRREISNYMGGILTPLLPFSCRRPTNVQTVCASVWQHSI